MPDIGDDVADAVLGEILLDHGRSSSFKRREQSPGVRLSYLRPKVGAYSFWPVVIKLSHADN
jgi:hypothetical protein